MFSRLSVCLTRHNYQSDQVSFSLYPRNGYTGTSWKKLKLEDTTDFTLKTYELRCQFFKAPIEPCFVNLQIIEHVSWSHTNGLLFVQDILKHFDIQEAQYSIYNEQLLHRQDAPSALQLFQRMVSSFSLIKFLMFNFFSIFRFFNTTNILLINEF